eukprot:TRINITY_DN18069_c0_g1_i1.p1 TRINITY_DN18069_c0_g1~~TRINITY_DN18069_c0_g1_i1.p1  ORF type:complete len:671 (-),score=226.57 TRINITY_DN18069_c0_g1_i1:228-2240(-)
MADSEPLSRQTSAPGPLDDIGGAAAALDVEQQRQKAIAEREVEFAELETRIRKYNLDLLQPTIRKTSMMEQVVADLREEFSKTAALVAELTRTSAKVENQVLAVESFREEMSKWDSERREAQASFVENMSTMKQDLDMFRYSLEREDASIHSIQRTVDRAVEEIQRVQAASDTLQTHVNARIGQQNKLLNGTKADLEVRLIALETKHNRLSDELWGEATGLTKVTRDLSKTDETVAFLSKEILRMEHEKAHVSQLEAIQGEVNRGIGETNANVFTLKKTLDTMLSDVKDHFKTATNTVAAHSATMLSEVRNSYQVELERSASLRSECTKFMDEARQEIKELSEQMNTSSASVANDLRLVKSDVDEVSKLRKRDRGNTELEARQLAEQVQLARKSADSMASAVEHLSTVITIMLESERAACALYMQDDVDRAKVALVGFRDGAKEVKDGSISRQSTRAPSSGRSTRVSPLPSVAGTPRKERPGTAGTEPDRPNDKAAPDDGSGPVISVDQRCLSCSGQGQTVLSGFKMACLQYAPGPVTYERKTYARSELLDLREQLLHQALEALTTGPSKMAEPASPSSRVPTTSCFGPTSNRETSGDVRFGRPPALKQQQQQRGSVPAQDEEATESKYGTAEAANEDGPPTRPSSRGPSKGGGGDSVRSRSSGTGLKLR